MGDLDNYQHEANTSSAPKPKSIELCSSGLFSLPGELLLTIFDELDPHDLYHLALVSRRLNYTALPVYFSRMGHTINYTEVFELGGKTLDVLPALRAAFFITSIKHISCTFSYSQDKLMGNVRDLHAVLSRLSVDEVTLNFLLVDTVVSNHRSGRFKEKMIWKDGIAELKALFSVIVGKARVFTIRGGKHLAWLLEPVIPKEEGCVDRPEKPLARLFAAFKNRLGTPARPVERSLQDSISPHHGSFQQTKVESLEIHSSVLLSPSFRDWAIQIINASPISNLSFSQELSNLSFGQELNRQCWSDLLSRVHIPTASQLSLKSCPMALADLSLFMSRHPGITTLNLHDNGLYICDSYEIKSFLPHVITLTATPDCTRTLLALEGSFPNLRSLTILSTVRGWSRFKFSRLDSYLAPITHRIKDIVLTLNLNHYLYDSTHWKGVDLDEEEGPPRVLHCVSKFELRWWRFDDIPDVAHLNALLSRFPMLEHLSIAQSSPPLIAGRTPTMNVVNLINDACPWIKSMSLNGENYTNSSRLRTEGT